MKNNFIIYIFFYKFATMKIKNFVNKSIEIFKLIGPTIALWGDEKNYLLFLIENNKKLFSIFFIYKAQLF